MTGARTQEGVGVEGVQRRGWGLMLGLSAGHALKHFHQQGLLLLLPAIKATLGLTDVEVGLIGAARNVTGTTLNIPAGIIADIWRSKVALILASSLTCVALGYLLMGASPNYWLLLLGAAITGGGAPLWHAPAFGTLAAVYPERRALALAAHRTGGSLGDTLSPLVIGVLLGGFAFWGLEWAGLEWQALALLLVVPAMVGAVAVLLFYRRLEAGGEGFGGLREYVRSARPLLTNSSVLSMVALSGAHAMAFNALTIFLILYMREDLAFSVFKTGYHLALLTLFGSVFAPLMGWMSDKIGRRPVIFLGLSGGTILVFSFLFFGTGWSFTIILAFLGLFLYSVNAIMLATAVEASKKGTEASGVALIFSGGAVFGAISPVIAGWLRQVYGMEGVFYFSGAIVASVAVASLFVPMRRATERATAGV